MGSSHRHGAQASAALRLRDPVRDYILRLGLAERTGGAYCDWIVRFSRSNAISHPREMDAPEVEALLTRLASKPLVAALVRRQPWQSCTSSGPSCACVSHPATNRSRPARFRATAVPVPVAMEQAAVTQQGSEPLSEPEGCVSRVSVTLTSRRLQRSPVI